MDKRELTSLLRFAWLNGRENGVGVHNKSFHEFINSEECQKDIKSLQTENTQVSDEGLKEVIERLKKETSYWKENKNSFVRGRMFQAESTLQHIKDKLQPQTNEPKDGECIICGLTIEEAEAQTNEGELIELMKFLTDTFLGFEDEGRVYDEDYEMYEPQEVIAKFKALEKTNEDD